MAKWQDPEVIFLWILIIVIFVLTLTIIILILIRTNFKKQVDFKLKESKAKLHYKNQLLNASIQVQEKERLRFSSDLHDAVIGKLSTIQMLLQLNKKKEDITPLLADSIDVARRISHDLSPPLVDELSLKELLESIILPLKANYEIAYHNDIRHHGKLPKDFKVQMTRIVQELLQNIKKHAKASRIEVRLKISQNYLAIILKDNGVGYDSAKIKRGLGMKNIEMRIDYLNGLYKFKSIINQGSKSVILIPLVKY